jgi:hypothetical protein
MITLDLSILNQKGTPMFNSDIFANRPNFGIPGRIFISTDTQEIYRDTGSSWDQLGGGGGGGTISGTIAAGQVAFGTAANTIGGSADLTWDGTNLFFGNSDGIVLQTAGTNRNTRIFAFSNNDNFAGTNFYPNSGTNVGQSFNIIPKGTGFTATIKSQFIIFGTDFITDSTNWEAAIFRSTGTFFTLATGKAGTGTIRPLLLSAGAADTITNVNQLWLYETGNVGINTLISGDTGQRLQVIGDTFLKGSGNSSTTTALTIQNSDGINVFRARNEGRIFLGSSSSSIYPMDKSTTSLALNGNGLSFFDTSATSGDTFYFTGNDYTNTSGVARLINATRLFWPTSGTGTLVMFNISPNINQTGGANGITRGLYVNPTLTAAADFRAIETSRGSIIFSGGIVTSTTSNYILNVTETFQPTSGSATSNLISINPVIDQTGTANGITRGLLINPSLTSAADWRSIEMTNNSGWAFYANGSAASYFAGNLQLGSTTPIASNIRLQVNGLAHILDTRTYTSGTIQSFVVQKNTIINSVISTSSGICNYVSTGDNLIGSSQSVPDSTSFANIYAFNKYQFNSAGLTLTATQAAPGVRTISQIFTQNVFKGTNSGTITHMSGIQIGGYYNDNTGTITPIIPDAYQLLINDTGAYGHTFTFTRRWGIYQEGINDRNYLAGNLMLNSTTDTGQILQVNGAIRVNGQLSSTMGAPSGQHLLINCDGTTYKINLFNP